MENRFAAARRRYLRTHMDGIYTGMLLTGTLEPHLAEIGESAQAMFDRLVEQMKKAEKLTPLGKFFVLAPNRSHFPMQDCSWLRNGAIFRLWHQK